MKYRQSLLRLTKEEITNAFTAAFSILKGQGIPHRKIKQVEKSFNYLDYLNRKKALVN